MRTREQIVADWAQLEVPTPFSDYEREVSSAEQWIGEPIEWVIPSIVLGPDGPRLSDVLAVTNHHMVSIEPTGEERFRYGFMYRGNVEFYTVSPFRRAVQFADGHKDLLDVMNIRITLPKIHFDLSYVGAHRDAWMTLVLDALPISLLAPSGPVPRNPR